MKRQHISQDHCGTIIKHVGHRCLSVPTLCLCIAPCLVFAEINCFYGGGLLSLFYLCLCLEGVTFKKFDFEGLYTLSKITQVTQDSKLGT